YFLDFDLLHVVLMNVRLSRGRIEIVPDPHSVDSTPQIPGRENCGLRLGCWRGCAASHASEGLTPHGAGLRFVSTTARVGSNTRTSGPASFGWRARRAPSA